MECLVRLHDSAQMVLGGCYRLQGGQHFLFSPQLLEALQRFMVCLQRRVKLLRGEALRALEIPCQGYLGQQVVPDFSFCVWLYLFQDASAKPVVRPPSVVTLDDFHRIHIAVQDMKVCSEFSFLVAQMAFKQSFAQQIALFVLAKLVITPACHSLAEYIRLSFCFSAFLFGYPGNHQKLFKCFSLLAGFVQFKSLLHQG